MVVDEHCAVVDNDFLSHLAECQRLPLQDIHHYFTAVLDGQIAIVHPLVYQKEVIQNNRAIQWLFDNGTIAVPSVADAYQNDVCKKEYYVYLLKELYKKHTGDVLAVSTDTAFTYWKYDQSLGEMHSLSMCLVCGCGVFLSDDSDSVELATFINQSGMGNIDVYDRSVLFNRIAREIELEIPKRARSVLTHSTQQHP